MHWLDSIRWNADGLTPAVAQHAATGKVLTLAWMNREALARTWESGEAHYWSRSRGRLWHKGESSGHVQTVCEIRLDCDRDAILLVVEQHGGIACHTGREHCFYRRLEDERWVEVEPVIKDPHAIYGDRAAAPALRHPAARAEPRRVLRRVADAIESRKGADAATSYVASLFAKGDDAILKKIGEEATETVMAAKDGEPSRIVAEIADLWFHSLVLLARHGLGPEAVEDELARREGTSGHAEKAARRTG